MKKLYIVVRNDIPPGLQIAQCCHALRQFAYENPDDDQEWFMGSDWQRPQAPHGDNIIAALQVPNERALLDLLRRLQADDEMSISMCREPDLGGQCTAMAVYGDGAEKYFSNLPLALRGVSSVPAAPRPVGTCSAAPGPA